MFIAVRTGLEPEFAHHSQIVASTKIFLVTIL